MAIDLQQVQIRRATVEDLSAVMSILREGTGGLHSRGINQWQWYLSDRAEPDMREHIVTDEVYLALVDDHPGATFLIQWSDEECWDARGSDGLAGYVHSLAVRRAYAGLGAHLLAW